MHGERSTIHPLSQIKCYKYVAAEDLFSLLLAVIETFKRRRNQIKPSSYPVTVIMV